MKFENARSAIRGAIPLALVAGATLARADITVDTAGITAAGTAVATVGAAVFLVYIGIKVYKWVRRAL